MSLVETKTRTVQREGRATVAQHGFWMGIFGGYQRDYYYEEPITESFSFDALKRTHQTVYQTQTDRPIDFSLTHHTLWGATHFVPESPPEPRPARDLKERIKRSIQRRREAVATAEAVAQETENPARVAEVTDLLTRVAVASTPIVEIPTKMKPVRRPDVRNGFYAWRRQVDVNQVTVLHGALYRAFHRGQQAPETAEIAKPTLARRRPSPRSRTSAR